MMLPRFLFLLVVVFVQLPIAYCQDNDLHFTKISSKDGLSSNTVNVILKDQHGLMWFGTQDGLNKFDGTNFTIYRHKWGDSSSLQANEITALYEDRKGNLLIGTNGGSLSIYDRRRDSFIHVKSFSWAKNLGNAVRTITSDYLGNIWVGGYDGLSTINLQSGKIHNFEINHNKKGALSTRVITVVYEDRKKRMWVGTDQGLYLYDRRSGGFISFLHQAADPFSLAGDNVTTIFEDKKGRLLVATLDGLSVLLPGKQTFLNFRHSERDKLSLSHDKLYAIAQDKGGKIWIGAENGLNILDENTWKFTRIFADKRNLNSLTAKTIRSIYIDNQGIYWVGAYQGGINKYDKNLNLFSLKQSNPFDAKGLRGSVVTSFAQADEEKIYIGTDDGGLNLFNVRTRLFEPLPFQGLTSDLPVHALQISRRKHLWIGTYSAGLFDVDLTSGRVKHYVKGSGPKNLSDNLILALKEDSRGLIWIGTNGSGVNVYNPVSGDFMRLNKQPEKGNIHLPLNGYIRCIEEDKNGNIWIGSHGSGLAVYNPRSNSCEVYTSANSGLPANVVLSIFSDRQNRIWVGTLGGGLGLFDNKTKRFVSFTEKDGLSNNVLYKVIQDYKGVLWISSNSGISSFDLKARKFTNYTHHNGVQSSGFVMGAGFNSSAGELFFGGLEGFNYIDPGRLNKNMEIPGILFTDLKVLNRSVTAADSGIINSHISIAKEIKLNYKQGFSLTFVALNYTSPQENKYAYKLEGFDKDWIYSGAVSTATYTNLDPATYTFKVRACNNDGVWNNEGKSIKIIVSPPFWRTIYAYFFYLIAFTGGFLFLRYRTLQKLNARFVARQERQEADRARELDQLKIKFLTNLSHEFRTPISLIMGPVDKLLSQQKDHGTIIQLQLVSRNARRLLNLVNQLLDFRKMEENELRLNKSNGYFISGLKEVSDSFIDVAERKKIDYRFDSKIGEFYTSFDKDKIERILFNLLSNAFKFTLEGGKVGLVIEPADQPFSNQHLWVRIKVTDTGIGIPSGKQKFIFERFFQNTISPSLLNQGSGIGLSITKEFVCLHGGSISVESEPDKGSEFIIELPLEILEPEADNQQPSSAVVAEQYLKEPENIKEDETVSSDIPSILLVEDNKDFLFYLKDNLKRFYRIYEASTGSEGWQKALSKHPLLIVSDITMPGMSGIELCEKIKSDQRTKHIPVILLTAMAGEGELLKGLETGANDYITKPFNFEVLNFKIRNLLSLQETFKHTYSRQIKLDAAPVHVETEDARLLKEIAAYIEANLTNSNLSVEDLSNHVGMHRGTFYRRLLNITGETPVEYIRSYKLQKAKDLLERSDYTISQICYSVGFSTPSYFTKAFKLKYGLTPSEFAAKHTGFK